MSRLQGDSKLTFFHCSRGRGFFSIIEGQRKNTSITQNEDEAGPAMETALPNFDDLWDYNKPGESEVKFCALLLLATQRELLKEFTDIGETDGYVYEEMGGCLLALGQAAEARQYFARAYAELSKDLWLPESEPARLQRLGELGNA